MKTDNWLDGADGIVIECEEEDITPYTLILVTPLYSKGEKSPKGSGGQRTMVLKEAMEIKGKLIVKNSPKLLEYIQTRMGKRMFD
jgi:hypothetical protein